MKKLFQHTKNGQIFISDGRSSYCDSLQNFLLDSRTYKGLPIGFTERIYIPEDIHVLGGQSGQTMQSLSWDNGDQYIAQVDQLLVKQAARNEPISLSLDESKEFKWKAIKAERDRIEQSGLSYLGKILDSDTTSVQRISVAVQAAQSAIAAGQQFSIVWTCQDDSMLELTAEQICGIPVALAMYSNQLHQTARQLKKVIDAAKTLEQVAAVSWPNVGNGS